jgi:F0F1-type ATP synthase assembly protein I
MGFALVALVVLFTAAGYGLDRWLGTKPWLMVTGVFVGFGLGLAYLAVILRADPSDRRSGKKGRERGGGPGKGSS